ncbi:unnamed protein product [Nesidiocoris tenuis]|uniref:RNA polymerase II subunit A C-terminal domain phosphatase n=1 Tax=Nesidiocoris tenuis TaxID=355587 RepID=A0A6H5GRR2_9HEMI|nr:unnamed protein product [Nesidiocoris tenuis]
MFGLDGPFMAFYVQDVYHFQLLGPHSSWYHTRLRPGTMKFLKSLTNYYELHICTFGVRPYAHMIAKILDPDGSLFGGRILSRDECFSSDSKFANLQALFPCGDELVCIIDDRDDVWNYSPNLIQVKPYLFFRNTGDIHEPGVTPSSRASTYLAPGVRIKENTSSQVPLVPKGEELKNIDVDDDEDAADDDMNEEMPNLDEHESRTEKSSSGKPSSDTDQNSAENDSPLSKDSKNPELSGDNSDVKMDCTDKDGPQTEPEDLSCDKKVKEVPPDKEKCANTKENDTPNDNSTDKEPSPDVEVEEVQPAVEPMDEGAKEEEDEDVEEVIFGVLNLRNLLD